MASKKTKVTIKKGGCGCSGGGEDPGYVWEGKEAQGKSPRSPTVQQTPGTKRFTRSPPNKQTRSPKASASGKIERKTRERTGGGTVDIPEDVAQCVRAKTKGGFTRHELDELAEFLDLDSSDYREKEELCDAIMIQIRDKKESLTGKTMVMPGQRIETFPPRAKVPDNQPIVNYLYNELKPLSLSRDNRFEYRAIRAAMNKIENFNEKITDPDDVPGIGTRMKARIRKFIE